MRPTKLIWPRVPERDGPEIRKRRGTTQRIDGQMHLLQGSRRARLQEPVCLGKPRHHLRDQGRAQHLGKKTNQSCWHRSTAGGDGKAAFNAGLAPLNICSSQHPFG